MAQQQDDNVMRRYSSLVALIIVARGSNRPLGCPGIVLTHRLCRKLVIIGDGACGKTSLLSVFTLGYFPTVSNNFL